MGKRAHRCRLCGSPLPAVADKTLPHGNDKNRDEALCSLLVALVLCRGNKSRAAKMLGASPATVWRHLGKLKEEA